MQWEELPAKHLPKRPGHQQFWTLEVTLLETEALQCMQIAEHRIALPPEWRGLGLVGRGERSSDYMCVQVFPSF